MPPIRGLHFRGCRANEDSRVCRAVAGAIALAVICLAAAGPAAACSAPVFRYALENWPPDSYEVVLFHRGPLSEEQAALAAEFGEAARVAQSGANLTFRAVDLGDSPAAEDAALFEKQNVDALPLMLVRYPAAKRATNVSEVWRGPFSRETVDRLIDSPARREIARRILDGHSVVWVFLDGGDAKRDDAKFALLETELKRLEATLTLPEIDPADIAGGEISAAAASAGLRPRFSAVRIKPGDAAEELFAAMLRNSEEDGTDQSLSAFAGQPLAFPIFGRGRALFAYVGEGINRHMIEDGCSQLIEKCLCTRKADFAGTDLVMAVDWNALVEVAEPAPRALPPLSGPGAFLASPANGEDNAADDLRSSDSPAEPAPDAAGAPGAASAAASAPTQGPASPGADSDLLESSYRIGTLAALVILLVLGVIFVGAFTVFTGRTQDSR